jgi:glyoxylate reductase
VARVVSSAHLPIDIAPILGGGVDYEAPKIGSFSRSELLERVSGADALICLLDVEVDEELLDRAGPDLAIIANFAVGTDNVDLPAATRRGIWVSNTPDVLTAATADFTFALLLAIARRVIEADRLARSGGWSGWAPGLLLGAEVGGATLGIVGHGRIGSAVARRARGFDMEVVTARSIGLDALARVSDYVTLHCPLNDETADLVDRDFLERMKPTAFLINTARGGCVDEPALVAALDAGVIAGAALDVFADEPAIHPGLVASDRVVLAPHAGSATVRARGDMARICARAVRAVVDGGRPATAVNEVSR